MSRLAPLRSLSLSLLALTLVACGGSDAPGSGQGPAVAAGPNPQDVVTASVANLRNNNIAGLLQVVMPPAALAEARAEFDRSRQEAISDSERAQFNQMMTKLTAPGAEDALFAELKPQMDELRPQLPMMFGFGQAMAAGAVQQNAELTPEQRVAATTVVNAMMGWLQNADILNEDRAKRAIAVVCQTARGLNIATLDDARQLNFDQAMEKGGMALGGIKQLLAIYDFQVDEVLDSVRAEVLSTEGDAATLKISYNVFGSAHSVDTNLVRHEGRWFGHQAVENL